MNKKHNLEKLKKTGRSPYLFMFITPLLFVIFDISNNEKDKFIDYKSGDNVVKQDTVPNNIQTLPGFEVQMLYDVPRETQGTWVSLTMDPEGRFIASSEYDNGMYRITVGDHPDTPDVEVDKLIMPLSGAQGMVWAFDYLYANTPDRGLFRMRDIQSNDQLNLMEYLGGPNQPSDHGNHALIPTRDGEELFVVNGNHTPPPDLNASRVSNWEEDILLPRQWDARGHARGILAPGGYFARINPDATRWEMFSIGYRNTYDAAINQHGEIFTFDSDMEWDMGMPWYRPTRVLHVVSGSDYGWRSGSGKWKAFYEDSLTPVLNVGPASPTGVLFGTGAKFPAKYQRALFGLDWTYGTMYAFHLTPKGASYTATAEEFLSGSPLALTDAVIGKDGAMYFITGGWNNDTKLYRVIYKGEKSTAPAEPIDNPEARKARKQRHKLEEFHGVRDPKAIEVAWPFLAHEDRFLRHAARVAIEAQPTKSWAEKALSEERPQARITGMVALARTASADYRDRALNALLDLDLNTLSPDLKLGYLRAMSLIFMRLGDPGEPLRSQITDTLLGHLPGEEDRVNVELVRLLVYLKEPGVIDKALALMRREEKAEPPDWGSLVARNEKYGGTIQKMLKNPPPTNKLEYAFMLRNMQNGWTISQRREYFKFINNAANAMGGMSYSGFLERMRDEALANATGEEQKAVADITAKSLKQEPPFEVNPPEGPGRNWTVEEAVETVEGQLKSRDFENGRNAFFATNCASCHRFDGYGGNIGPDLGTVGHKFSTKGLIENIIKPSMVISSQFNNSQVKLKNGDRITGLVIEEEEYVKVYSRDPDQAPRVIPRKQVTSIEKIDVSQMPPGLINTLNAEELRDLVAYLKSGGDPEDEMFKEDGQ